MIILTLYYNMAVKVNNLNKNDMGGTIANGGEYGKYMHRKKESFKELLK